jgi:hypothetical protein
LRSCEPGLGQNIISGKFTLTQKTRVGGALLPAGECKFSIEPAGNLQSMSSIQGGAGHPVRVVLRPEKSGPVVTIFAMASPSEHTQGPSGLVLSSGNGEEIARSMYLEKEGLVVDFNWWGAKEKTETAALATAAPRSGARPPSGGTE